MHCTLTITDNGIGMTKEEMEEHLGTIANSGSLQFKKENNLAEDNQIIGQFGVGFYSAFMVAKRVTVKSLAFGETQGYVWQSEGVEGYTMDTCDKDTVGTEITLDCWTMWQQTRTATAAKITANSWISTGSRAW